jgi:hypothetical protein
MYLYGVNPAEVTLCEEQRVAFEAQVREYGARRARSRVAHVRLIPEDDGILLAITRGEPLHLTPLLRNGVRDWLTLRLAVVVFEPHSGVVQVGAKTERDAQVYAKLFGQCCVASPAGLERIETEPMVYLDAARLRKLVGTGDREQIEDVEVPRFQIHCDDERNTEFIIKSDDAFWSADRYLGSGLPGGDRMALRHRLHPPPPAPRPAPHGCHSPEAPRRSADLPAAQCPGHPPPAPQRRNPAEVKHALLEQLARLPEAHFYGKELERRYGIDLTVAEAEGLVQQTDTQTRGSYFNSRHRRVYHHPG